MASDSTRWRRSSYPFRPWLRPDLAFRSSRREKDLAPADQLAGSVRTMICRAEKHGAVGRLVLEELLSPIPDLRGHQ